MSVTLRTFVLTGACHDFFVLVILLKVDEASQSFFLCGVSSVSLCRSACLAICFALSNLYSTCLAWFPAHVGGLSKSWDSQESHPDARIFTYSFPIQVPREVVTEEDEAEDEVEDEAVTEDEVEGEAEVEVELELEPRRVVQTLSSSPTGTRVSSLLRARYVYFPAT